MQDVRGKRVLVVGLGLLGGGVSTARWLVAHGARVTITDLRDAKTLEKSLVALGTYRSRVKLVLGKHREKDFTGTDIVVANQAISPNNRYLELARRAGIPIEDDLTLFLAACKNPIVAITGTRGKTTTTNWVAHFLRALDPKTKAAGNSSDTSLLKLLSELGGSTPAVVELSSFQLEYMNEPERSPDVAIITNIFRDHLNRHGSMPRYALAKANVFRNQTADQNLILNAGNKWTPFFLKQKPEGRVWFTSLKNISKKQIGIFVHRGAIVFRAPGKKILQVLPPARTEKFREEFGTHNLENLLASMLGAYLSGLPWKKMARRIGTLPTIPYRQEVVLKKGNVTIVNDSAGTSPEATTAALLRFRKTRVVLVTGGTDKNLAYGDGWARAVKRVVRPENLFLLNGSATKKMLRVLRASRYFKNARPQVSESLEEIVRAVGAQKNTPKTAKTTLIFSPGAASFEKFKNEFDRGEKFTSYVEHVFRA